MAKKQDEPLEMLGGKRRLSPMEREYMRYIWEYPDGIGSEEIYEHFPQARGTKSTVLYNISQKGYVEKRQEGLHHIYAALVSRAEYEQALVHQQFLKSAENSVLGGVVAAFCGKETLEEREKQKVQKLLEEMKRDAESGESVD